MKVNGPAYEIECSSVNDSIVFLPPGDEKRFSIRLFLKGAAMNRASGVPGRSRELLLGAFPRKGPLVAPQQVHGTDVIAASTGATLPARPSADGVCVDRCGIEASLRFADCFPVVIASLSPSPRIILLHSGYKGTVQNIAGRAARSLLGEKGAEPSETWAWIGPGIGKEHYFRKKDEPWTKRGIESFSRHCVSEDGNDVFFDLGGEIRRQLKGAGILDEMICSVPLCTFRDNDVCYSYRKGDRENRLFLLAWME